MCSRKSSEGGGLEGGMYLSLEVTCLCQTVGRDPGVEAPGSQ